MNVLVAMWVEQHVLLFTILSAFRFLSDTMDHPSRPIGDLLVTDRAETVLLPPEKKNFPFSQEGMCHLDPKAFFKVHFPCGVIRSGFCSDFRVSLDRHKCCAEEPAALHAALFVRDVSSEDPVPIVHALEVFLPHPVLRFIGVSSSGPLPECPEDCLVHFRERLLADLMSVIRGPSSNHRIEDAYQVSGRGLLMCLDGCSDLL